jgi:hypothetical protein
MDQPEARIDSITQLTFLGLILTQAAHSIEEILFRLYDVFAPARFVASAISSDPARGFVIGNVVLVLFGLWCYVARVRTSHRTAGSWMLLWIVIECANGIVHIAMSVRRQGYFLGVATAPLLLLLAIYLAVRMRKQAH